MHTMKVQGQSGDPCRTPLKAMTQRPTMETMSPIDPTHSPLWCILELSLTKNPKALISELQSDTNMPFKKCLWPLLFSHSLQILALLSVAECGIGHEIVLPL